MNTEINTCEVLTIRNENAEAKKAAAALAEYLVRLNNPDAVYFSAMTLQLDGVVRAALVAGENGKKDVFAVTPMAGNKHSPVKLYTHVPWAAGSVMAQVAGEIEGAKHIRWEGTFAASMPESGHLGCGYWKNALQGPKPGRPRTWADYRCLEFCGADETVEACRFDGEKIVSAPYGTLTKQAAGISTWRCRSFVLLVQFKDSAVLGDPNLRKTLRALGAAFAQKYGLPVPGLCFDGLELTGTLLTGDEMPDTVAESLQPIADFAGRCGGDLKLEAVFTPSDPTLFDAARLTLENGRVKTEYCNISA